MFGLGPMEMLIVGVVAVLLFGNRLPELARSMGKSLVEFKKGMRGIEEEFHSASHASTASTSRHSTYNHLDDRAEPSAPRFIPPTTEPKEETSK